MNSFTRFLREFFAIPFKELRDQLREEEPEELRDGSYDISEWLGFLGASAWLLVSFGRIKWDNEDWRAVSSGVLLIAVALVLVAKWAFRPPVLA